MSAKHSCKNTEYETFDFGSSGPNRTPTQKGKMNTKEKWKKTGPQRRREKRPRTKIRKNNTKKMRKKTGPPRTSLKKQKIGKSRKIPRVLCVFFYFAFVLLLFCFFFRFLFVFFFFAVLFVFFGVFLLFFLLFFSPLPRGRCFCARRLWRPKSLI